MAMTLAMLVAVMTASSSKKLPKVNWPIDSENDRNLCKIAATNAGMVMEPGRKARNIYKLLPFQGGNMAEMTVTPDHGGAVSTWSGSLPKYG
jgi:hypothetical protein